MPARVSVVMSVYNGEKYLGEAIESILKQTFTDFEFIIIDDGSRDNSLAIVHDYVRQDERIQIIEHRKNQGLSVSLNKGIRVARGEYIARMDADDISIPDRIAYQVAYLDANPHIDVCGSWLEMIGDRMGQVVEFPLDHTSIYLQMLFSNPIAHPTVMVRAISAAKNSMLYDEDVRYAQDYELWTRAIEFLRFANIDQALVLYRIHSCSAGATHNTQQHQVHISAYRNVLHTLGMKPTKEELLLHEQICTHQIEQNLLFLRRARRWLEKLSRANRAVNKLPPSILDKILGSYWTSICHTSSVNPMRICFEILASFLPFNQCAHYQKLRQTAGFCYRKWKSRTV